MDKETKVFAIVGGGRWARVYLSVLCSLNLPYKFVLVTNSTAINLDYIKGKNFNVCLTSSLDNLFSFYDVKMALVVNSSSKHFETTFKILENKIPTLVEKPIVFNVDDLRCLYQTAQKKETHIFPALSFSYCSYLDNFSLLLNKSLEKIINLEIEWSDVSFEIRYGEIKRYDPDLTIAYDILPHIWTILSKLFGFPNSEVEIKSVDSNDSGNTVMFNCLFEGVLCKIFLKRESIHRARSIVVNFVSGKQLKLNFNNEPGVVTDGLNLISGDVSWNMKISPLTLLIQDFLQKITVPFNYELELKRSVSLVSFAERADYLLNKKMNF